MKFKQYSWLVGAIAVVTTIGVLFGGQLLWQKYAVAKPLDSVFQGIKGVETATWEESGKNGEPVKIYATLKNVENLEKTYTELMEGSQRVLGRKSYRIIIRDDRTPELEAFYYNIHYHVQEAISNGNYSLMAERIQEKAETDGVDVQVYVATAKVYIQMQKDGKGMYVIVDRQLNGQEVK
jgi:hypothetical protein